MEATNRNTFPTPSDRTRQVQFQGRIFLAVGMGSIRVNSAPEFDLFLRPGPEQPFVLYCERRTSFTEQARLRLERNMIEDLYIQKDDLQRYNLYIAENLDDILSDKRYGTREKSVILYDCAQAVVGEILHQPHSVETLVRGKQVVSHTVGFMTGAAFKVEDLLRTLSCEYYLYTHSVNVATYTIALSMRAGFADHATLREIGQGAMLHDIGESLIDPEILNKVTSLSGQEWDIVQRHPITGHDLMLEAGCFGEIARDITLHHHERLDGSGYPHGLRDRELSPFIRMVSICDVFDALTTDRFHQQRKSTFEALSFMHKNLRDELDLNLLKSFTEMLGLRP